MIKLHEYEKREFWKQAYLMSVGRGDGKSSAVEAANNAAEAFDQNLEQQQEQQLMLGNVAAPINPAYMLPSFPSRTKGRRND